MTKLYLGFTFLVYASLIVDPTGRLQIGSLSINILLIAVFLVATFVYFYFIMPRQAFPSRSLSLFYSLTLILIFAIWAIPDLVSGRIEAWQEGQYLLLSSSSPITLAAFKNYGTRKSISLINYAILISATAVSVATVFLVLSYFLAPAFFPFAEGFVTLTLFSPNIKGNYYIGASLTHGFRVFWISSIVILPALMIASAVKWSKPLIKYSFLIVSLLAIICSGSRNSLLVLAFLAALSCFYSILRYGSISARLKLIYLQLALSGALLIWILFMLFPGIFTYFMDVNSRLNFESIVNDERLSNQLSNPIRLFGLSPLIGHGLGLTDIVSDRSYDMENFYLGLLVKLGISGIVLFFFPLFSSLYLGLRSYFSFTVSISILSIYLQSATNPLLFNSVSILLLSILYNLFDLSFSEFPIRKPKYSIE